MATDKPSRRPTKKRSPYGHLKRLLSDLRGKRSDRTMASKAVGMASNPLAGVAASAKRTQAEWKEHRRITRAAVRAHLEANQPIQAIKKLTLALLEDPEFQPYHDLLCKAAEQRHARRLKPGESDPWASMANDLRTETIKLEAFAAYVNELEQLLKQAGVPALSAPKAGSKTGEAEP